MKFDKHGDRICPVCGKSVSGNLGNYNRHVVQEHGRKPTSGSKERFAKKY